MVNRGFTIHASYAANLREAYGEDVFEATVPASTDYKVAVTLRKCVGEHKPRGVAAKAIEAVGEEILSRIEARCGHLVSGAPALEKGVA